MLDITCEVCQNGARVDRLRASNDQLRRELAELKRAQETLEQKHHELKHCALFARVTRRIEYAARIAWDDSRYADHAKLMRIVGRIEQSFYGASMYAEVA